MTKITQPASERVCGTCAMGEDVFVKRDHYVYGGVGPDPHTTKLKEWELMDRILLCTEDRSDHYGHVIMSDHPRCRYWVRREP